MVVQLLRAATECEFDLVPEPGQVMQRARTSDAKSSNSPPAQGALHDPITLGRVDGFDYDEAEGESDE